MKTHYVSTRFKWLIDWLTCPTQSMIVQLQTQALQLHNKSSPIIKYNSGDTNSSFQYQKLAPNRTQLYSVQISGTKLSKHNRLTIKLHSFGLMH